ncbi:MULTISPECIES: hypothetical protein [Cytobacillus]|uniref:hypothetical protein n=1 Tax=Cytobacillus TaxID=2675230 RepID=UPI0015D5FADD|nr:MULTISPECIES: hypothetical protein [Cytobacillus]MEA1851472.1 hypothetical protein [Cytobacillus sp. OWB-43]MED1605541.1 hypothetical protein [Cytobacillus kochii]
MSKEEKVPENSSMASNEEEIETLGKEMEQMKSKEELKEMQKTPDPKQEVGKRKS